MSSFATDVSVQLTLRPIEAKLFALSLDRAARGNEIATAAEKLINCLRSRGISTADVFRASSTRPTSAGVDGAALARALAMRMTFGKHRRKPLRAIPVSYLRWVKYNCECLSPELSDAISTVLKGS